MINILVTLNQFYIEPLRVMLCSLCESNPENKFRVFVVHSSLKEKDFIRIRSAVSGDRCEIVDTYVPYERFPDLPSSKRWPKEACYRIFAAHILPEDLDRVLYLDPDTVVINNLGKFYTIDFENNLFAACTHMFEPMQIICRARLNMAQKSVYINSGVMLINLEKFRKEQKTEQIYDYVKNNRKRIYLFDQDILNGLYHGKTLAVNPLLYNLDERYFKLHNMNPYSKTNRIDYNWVRENTVIIHFSSKKKPWHPGYKGEFGNLFYKKFAEKLI